MPGLTSFAATAAESAQKDSTDSIGDKYTLKGLLDVYGNLNQDQIMEVLAFKKGDPIKDRLKLAGCPAPAGSSSNYVACCTFYAKCVQQYPKANQGKERCECLNGNSSGCQYEWKEIEPWGGTPYRTCVATNVNGSCPSINTSNGRAVCSHLASASQ